MRRRSFVLSIPVARGANWFLAGGGRRMDEEEATAAAAERIAAAAEDGTSLPGRLATDVVRFLYGGTGRREPADGGVVSASLLNAKPAIGGIGVEPRGGGVLRVLFTVASDAVADTVVRWRHELRRCVDSTAVFDVLSDREEAQHQALWPAFLAAKVAGKRAQFHRARLVVDGERMDRFITARSAMDVDAAHLSLMNENDGEGGPAGAGAADNDAKKEYERQLAATMGVGNSRILVFKTKAPEPAAGHDNKLSGIYSANTGQAVDKKKFRHVPSEPKNVLGAPDIMNDFYLNVLDWSSQNVVAVALKETVYLWNGSTSTVSELCTLPEGADGEGRYVSSLSWAADGNFLAVGTSDAKVQIWDSSKGRQVRELAGHTNRVSSVAWNGSMLSSGGRDAVICNWDVRKKREEACVSVLRSHEQEVCGLKWSPCGQQLASGGNDNMLCIHDQRFELQHKINAHVSAVKAIAWCPFQSNLLATGGGTADRHIRFWNTHTGAKLNEIDTGSQCVCSLMWNHQKREIMSNYHHQ
ncbi:hypothetical protein FOA52_002554 [Chlamydomonas sp. UWO 241]|nr:hypothetical protein FOA52_002554 [Chlamydomonas sp. UWO 241]